MSTACRTTLYVYGRERTLTAVATRRLVARYVRKWTPRMAMDQWSITIDFSSSLETPAICYPEPRYEEATIVFNQRRLAEYSKEIEQVVVHELVHCIAWSASEAAVSRIARALLRTERLTRTRRRG